MSEGSSNNNHEKVDDKFNIKATAFLTTVAGFSIIAGFSTTLASAKRKDPQSFNKGFVATLKVPETGSSLAMRALAWGSLYAITGTGILCYGIWKLSGAKDLTDFRTRMGNLLPTIPKNDPPQSRTEFSGLNDLLMYVSTEKFGTGVPITSESKTKQ